VHLHFDTIHLDGNTLRQIRNCCVVTAICDTLHDVFWRYKNRTPDSVLAAGGCNYRRTIVAPDLVAITPANILHYYVHQKRKKYNLANRLSHPLALAPLLIPYY